MNAVITPGRARWTEMMQDQVPRLVGLARRILGSDDLAWDAVQETLLTLWREAEVPRHLELWLARTLRHRSLHLQRAHQRRRKHEKQVATRSARATARDPARELADQELGRQIQSALEALPEAFREVLLLRAVDGLDYGAIAARLDMPLGTVRSRLNRARALMRDYLGDDANDLVCWVCRDAGRTDCPHDRLDN